MKSKRYITLIICALSLSAHAQIGIGTTSPDASSVLDMTSTTQGVLIPRMTTTEREAIATPAIGLQVYDTDTLSVWTYNGAAWTNGTGGPGKFVEGGASDIAYYQDRVGIGINTFSTAHKLFVESIKSTDDTNTTVRFNSIYDGTGTSVSDYALANLVSNAGTGTIAYAIGTRSTIENVSGGTITAADGIRSEITNSATMDFVSGSFIQISNSGTIGQIIGQAIGHSGAGSVTDSYAMFISSNFNKGTNNNFAIYSASDADTYFEGNVGVGTSSPQQKVHISGALRLEPQATPPTGTLGDLYVGTDGNLYFNDGSAVAGGWKQVVLTP